MLWPGAGARSSTFLCALLGTPAPHLQTRMAENPYQFFKTRVVIRAAMTMMRETVMVTI